MNNKCNICNHVNHINNFICEGIDCGAPLDLEIKINNDGLPDII